MRAHEFINNNSMLETTFHIIQIDDDDEMLDQALDQTTELEPDEFAPAMISPLQQELELKKASLGKDNNQIQTMVNPETDDEPSVIRIR